jgi:citrate lyase subunit beta/citryl-CoA lyase
VASIDIGALFLARSVSFYAGQNKSLLADSRDSLHIRALRACGTLMTPFSTIALPLFAPADKPERYPKALASGADAVIFDLEDAVALSDKDSARTLLLEARGLLASAPCPLLVRINPEGGPFHAADLIAVRELSLAALVVPKVESADTVRRVADKTGLPVLAIIESGPGLAAARNVAAAGARLVFGSIDFVADLGCAHSREALLFPRCELVLASRLAGAPAPIDGVTTAVKDSDLVRDDVAYAVSLGFGGKLLIHPAQIEPAEAGLQPAAEDVRWASRVLAAGQEGGAASLDGMMVDAPVRLRAEQILRRAQRGRREVAQ